MAKPIQAWLQSFSQALSRRDGAATARLFADGAAWRDYLAFDWTLQTLEGQQQIARFIDSAVTKFKPLDYQDAHGNAGIFKFETAHGDGTGFVRMDSNHAQTLFTSLDKVALKNNHSPSDKPFVLIIGAGQSGLALAARLGAQGVPYLVVEKHARIGDNWRARYDSLVLHDPVWVNHLPFKPFPPDWPAFTPKDMMGDWLEDYAASLSLNVLNKTTLQSAAFDGQKHRWNITLNTDGAIKKMTVAQLVFAVGTSGFPRIPKFAGADIFAGAQMHSADYVNGAKYKGQNVAIIGATNSAHDIATDLLEHGACPTMIQRSSTHVVPHKVYIEQILGELYAPDEKGGLKRADFLSLTTPLRALEAKGRALFKKVQVEYAAFYRDLSESGFALDFAEDGSGIIGKYRRSASGYYIDVGGARRVMQGDIAVRSGVGVARLETDGLILTDGSKLHAESIIYATGFGSMEQWVARLVSQTVADKIGKCWGYGSGYRDDPAPWEGELRNMWKPTAQEGLWFMGGNLAQVRIYSHYLALQLLAKYDRAGDD